MKTLCLIAALLFITPMARAGSSTRPAAVSATQPAAYAPTSSYERRQVDGWDVYVARDLREEHPELAQKTLDLLRVKLFDMQRVLPAAAVGSLRAVPIWVEFDDHGTPGCCYHISAEWLREHGYNPEKAGGVEIGNAAHFLSWSMDQPAMLLHEFAHAYHNRVLGADNPEILAAYEHARSSGLYEHVLRASGRTERAYALNNAQEYFAESSEAFFLTNDFYPFVRAELEAYDPVMAATLRKLWRVSR